MNSSGAVSGSQQVPDNLAYVLPSSLEIIAGIDEVDEECVDSIGPQAVDESEQPHIFTFVEQLLGDFDCDGGFAIGRARAVPVRALPTEVIEDRAEPLM